MKKPFIIGIIVFLALLGVGYGLVISNLVGPKIQGKSVVKWTEELAGREPAVRDNAKKVIQDNAKDFLPHLASMMAAKDSEERQKWSTVLNVDYVPSYGMRLSANRAIALLGANAAPIIPQLIVLLADKDAGLDAAGALGSIGKDAIPALTEKLTNPDKQMRSMAAASFARMKAGEAAGSLDALIKGLQDEDPTTRGWMAKGIGQSRAKPEIAIPALIAALEDKETGVVAQAAGALGLYGPQAKDALPKLRTLSKVRNEELSGAAQGAVALIDPPPALAYLASLWPSLRDSFCRCS